MHLVVVLLVKKLNVLQVDYTMSCTYVLSTGYLRLDIPMCYVLATYVLL